MIAEIKDDQKCDKPGCDNLTFMAFLYPEGVMYACLDHYEDTAWDFEDYQRGQKLIRFFLFCDEHDELVKTDELTPGTDTKPPSCSSHPDASLRVFHISMDQMHKEPTP